MGTEIERKFLVREDKLPDIPPFGGEVYKQFYLALGPPAEVRVRIIYGRTNRRAVLTVKGKGALSRAETEVPIDPDEAEEMGKLRIGKGIHKARYRIDVGRHTWELDRFTFTRPEGDVIRYLAEVELKDLNEEPEIPEWAGEDVTHDARYKNASLAVHGWPVPVDLAAHDL